MKVHTPNKINRFSGIQDPKNFLNWFNETIDAVATMHRKNMIARRKRTKISRQIDDLHRRLDHRHVEMIGKNLPIGATSVAIAIEVTKMTVVHGIEDMSRMVDEGITRMIEEIIRTIEGIIRVIEVETTIDRYVRMNR